MMGVIEPLGARMQIAGESEVKAQIKLRFRTATGQPVVILRAFQVCTLCMDTSIRLSAMLACNRS
jgi:DNA repair protein RAD50